MMPPMTRVSLHLGRAAHFIPDPDRPRGLRRLLRRRPRPQNPGGRAWGPW